MRFDKLPHLIVVMLLTGCGGKAVIEESEEALAAYQSPIYTHQIPKMELLGMVGEYQKASESQFPDVDAIARQRLADLALEESEDELLSYTLDDTDSITNAGYYKAINIYQQLLKDYPDRSQNDHILYQLARAYDYAGEPLVVLKTLTELVELYPQSNFFAEAQYRRGELLFTLARFNDAVAAYKAVTDRGTGEPYYKHALYKHSWALYRSDRTSAAHHHFADLLEYLETPGDMKGVTIGNRELVSDILRVLAISFSQLKGAESIKSFADARENKPYTALVFNALADQFATQRLYKEAADVYSFYSDHYSDQPQAPSFHLKAIQFLEKGRNGLLSLKAREQFVERYGVNSEIWQRHPAELFEEIKPALKRHIIYLAKYHHGRYQQNNQVADSSRAQHWYKHFLNSFSKEEESGGIHFLYAENLYETGLFDQAAIAYEASAYNYKNHDKTAESGYAALISHEKRSDLDTEEQHRQLISSSQLFIKNFPEEPRINEVRHKKADQHLALKEYEAAIENLDPLVTAFANNSIQLGLVWYKLSYSHFMLENYSAVESSSQQALLHIKDSKKQKEVEERLAAAIYKQGEKAQAEGELSIAAAHFLRIMTTTPSASIAIQAQYDAAATYMNDSDWSAAAKVLENFSGSFPRHKLVQGAREKLAFTYREMGENIKAAHAYSVLANAEQNPEKKRIWLSQAADLHQQEDNAPLAIKMLEQYLALMTIQDTSYYEVKLRIANLHNKLGNTKAYRSDLKNIIARIGKNNKDVGLRQQAANATLDLARSHQKVFASIALTAPIKKALKHKKETMQATLKLYKQAGEYLISNVTTASTFQIAEIYREFSSSLLTSEQPKELVDEELEMYVMMLEEQAFPFEEKAIDLHKLNTKRVSSGIYDEWVKKSFQALGNLEPARFQKHESISEIITTLN